MPRNRTVTVILVCYLVLVVAASSVLIVLSNELTAQSDQLKEQTERTRVSETLVELSSRVEAELSAIEAATMTAAVNLSTPSMEDAQAEGQLYWITRASPYVLTSLTVDLNTTVRAVMPEGHEELLGTDLSGYGDFEGVMTTGRPVLSPYFRLVEGFYATVIICPIIDSGGRVSGAVSTMFRPDWMLENLSSDALAGTGFAAMVLESGGTVLYDKDVSQIGRNTFADPGYVDYPEIRSIASRMQNEGSGTGQYSYTQPGGSIVVRKEISWTTVSTLGMGWTVGIIRLR